MIKIYQQAESDVVVIKSLAIEAFGQARHACSVWQLRSGPPVLGMCLVIRDGDEPVGSLRYWEVRLGDEVILLLGPLAVRSGLWGGGYGRQLIEESLWRVTAGPWRMILVSGEEDYYSKFGFVPAAPYGIDWPGFIEPRGLQFFDLEKGALASLPSRPLPVSALSP